MIVFVLVYIKQHYNQHHGAIYNQSTVSTFVYIIRPTQGAMGKAFMLSTQIWLPQSCYTKAWSDTRGIMITAVFNVCNTIMLVKSSTL